MNQISRRAFLRGSLVVGAMALAAQGFGADVLPGEVRRTWHADPAAFAVKYVWMYDHPNGQIYYYGEMFESDTMQPEWNSKHLQLAEAQAYKHFSRFPV